MLFFVLSGTLVWRIEDFEVKAWPEEQYGSFYDGEYVEIVSDVYMLCCASTTVV